VFGAEDLGGFGEHGSSAEFGKQVGTVAEGGLAVMPEKESEPPQLRPRTIFDAEISVRRSAAACSMKRAT